MQMTQQSIWLIMIQQCIWEVGSSTTLTKWVSGSEKMASRSMLQIKTQLMVLTRKSKSSIANSVEVCLEGTPLQKRDSVRYLGIEVDNELSWKPHIHNLHRQCMAKLAQIRKSCYHLPCKCRKLLYLAFVLPQLDYCSVVWGSCGTILSNKIERI